MIVAILAYFFVETFQPAAEENGSSQLANISDEAYKAEMDAQRKQKDEFFRTSSESPIENKTLFHGLHYFEPNQDYRVLATLTPYEGNDKDFKVSYTDGTTDTYERFAYADFNVQGNPERLLLLKNEGTISVLFRDKTSGGQAYGGGRYIDIPLEDVDGNKLVIDFNKAYNPYCAYAPDFACPLPPAENTLNVAIEAGEQYMGENH